jgi:uncharacterized protein YukE
LKEGKEMNFSDFNEEQFTEANNDNSSADAPLQESVGNQGETSEETQKPKREKRPKGPTPPTPILIPAEIEAQIKARAAQIKARIEELINEASSLIDRQEQLTDQLEAELKALKEEGFLRKVFPLSEKDKRIINQNIKSIRRALQDIENRIENIGEELKPLSP